MTCVRLCIHAYDYASMTCVQGRIQASKQLYNPQQRVLKEFSRVKWRRHEEFGYNMLGFVFKNSVSKAVLDARPNPILKVNGFDEQLRTIKAAMDQIHTFVYGRVDWRGCWTTTRSNSWRGVSSLIDIGGAAVRSGVA
jgi:hypothetical protein